MRYKLFFQTIAVVALLSVGFGYVIFMAPKLLVAVYGSMQRLIRSPKVVNLLQNIVRPYLPTTTPEELFSKINQYRSSHNLPSFSQDAVVCAPVYTYDPSSQNIFTVCPTCTHATLLSISQYADSNTLLDQLLANNEAQETIESSTLTHACIGLSNEMLTLFFAQKTNTLPKKPGSIPVIPTAISPTFFNETELWQALANYRKAQSRSELTRDENICVYARKRVKDHLELLKTTEPDKYPVPDKYPLDAHSGFSADAASGYAFDITKKNQLAENLAYWPSAKSPVHIIEWGWDSSTEGHREAQLSNDWTSACITGEEGFYIAIFGR